MISAIVRRYWPQIDVEKVFPTCHDGTGMVQAVTLAQQRHVIREHAADVRSGAPGGRGYPAWCPLS